MAAVVENDEDPGKKASGENGDGQHEPIGNAESAIHRVPQDQVGNEGVSQLPLRSPGRGSLESRQRAYWIGIRAIYHTRLVVIWFAANGNSYAQSVCALAETRRDESLPKP